jgi:serine/threonine protein kinase
MRCMTQLNAANGVCPNCGFDNACPANEAHQLECRSILAGAYLVGCVIGQGGFGITYTAWDLNLNIKIAIKEYYPLGYAARDAHTHISVLTLGGDKKEFYQKGLERFVNEARTLARLTKDSGIVGVRGFFHENGTAYIVMDFVEGETLKAIAAKRGGKLPAQDVLQLFRPLCDSLYRVHVAGLLHRDISPDNIILRPDGVLTLVDFGAARQISAYGEHSNTINVKHGFAPEEQYRTHGEQGPWSDVYALCATIYRLTTGQTPPQALDRLTSGAPINSPRRLGADLTPAQENALLHGLGVNAQYRIRDMKGLIKELYAQSPASQAIVQPKQTPQKISVAKPAGEQAAHADPKKPARKNEKRKTIAIIAGSSVGVYLLILILVGAFSGQDDQQQARQFAAATSAPLAAVSQAQVADASPQSTTPPNPSRRILPLGFGETYRCSVDDFEDAYGIEDSQVTWTSSRPDIVYCLQNGFATAGYMQEDISQRFNDPVSVIGVAPNGVEFEYQFAVGNGNTYSFAMSANPKPLKNSTSFMYVASPSVDNCVGLTVSFRYRTAEGAHSGGWTLWVHDTSGEWISFTDLHPEDGVVSTYEVTFANPVNVMEIVMQPDMEYKEFSFYTDYAVSNVIFGE